MTHTFSSFTPAPSACFCCFSLALCQRRGPELPAGGPCRPQPARAVGFLIC